MGDSRLYRDDIAPSIVVTFFRDLNLKVVPANNYVPTIARRFYASARAKNVVERGSRVNVDARRREISVWIFRRCPRVRGGRRARGSSTDDWESMGSSGRSAALSSEPL